MANGIVEICLSMMNGSNLVEKCNFFGEFDRQMRYLCRIVWYFLFFCGSSFTPYPHNFIIAAIFYKSLDFIKFCGNNEYPVYFSLWTKKSYIRSSSELHNLVYTLYKAMGLKAFDYTLHGPGHEMFEMTKLSDFWWKQEQLFQSQNSKKWKRTSHSHRTCFTRLSVTVLTEKK